jgi:putative ATP-binding cassette transporter
MQAALAFQRVETAFAFCVTSYAKIAEWKAVMDRVAQFEAAMDEVDVPGPLDANIAIAGDGQAGLSIANLIVRATGGQPISSVPNLKLTRGERVLVSGPSGAGKSSLCRALAGIWPVGEGRILLPPNARLLALPQRAYFPLGTLRQAVTYPLPANEIDELTVRTALAAAGLGHLADRLDEEAEWSTLLSGGEQQRVGFARALINRPDVLLLDEAVSTLEDGEARDLYALLSRELPDTMVISIGRAPALVALHQRTIDMVGHSAASRSPRSSILVTAPA